MKNVTENQIAAMIVNENNFKNREVSFVEPSGKALEVKDLYKETYAEVMESLEDSKLINDELQAEIEARMLVAIPTYVNAIVKQSRIAEEVAKNTSFSSTNQQKLEQAQKIVKDELKYETPKGIAGVGTDAGEQKALAQAGILARKAKQKAEHLKNISIYGECTNGAPAGFTTATYFAAQAQPIKVKSDKSVSQDVSKYTEDGEAVMARINANLLN